jgi:HK97 family phage major capsid protein
LQPPLLIQEKTMSKLLELRQKLGELTAKLGTDEIIKDAQLFETTEAEIAEVKAQIVRIERAQAAQAALAAPVVITERAEVPADEVDTEVTLSSLRAQSRSLARVEGRSMNYFDNLSIARKALTLPEPGKRFKSLGENLQAIQQHALSRGANSDARLVRAPTGAGEVDPTGGGFLVQVDFAASIFMLAHDMGDILGAVNKVPISAQSNGLKIPGIDETSRATGSRWGGVSSKWAAEGVSGDESRPKFRLIEFDLKKLISKMTVTDELLADAPALAQIAGQAFSEEIMFMTEDAIVEGTGAGQPFGVLNSPALVTVAKQAGQAAKTFVYENVLDMWSRCWGRARKNAAWYINQDVEPQLFALNQTIGTGGAPIYLPPGGISQAPNATLFNRPVVLTEYNSTLGAVGDVLLSDFSQYTIVDKNSVQIASSIHVAFDTDEMRFRVTYRVDGKPMWNAPLTPFKGSATKSPFVTLAARP